MVIRQRSTILRQALILISQPSNALTAIRLIPPVWISHNFKAMTLKKDSKKTSTTTVAEIKTEANVADKASALVAAIDYVDIQTRQTIGCSIKRGKLYYLDLQSKDSNKLQQALMADGFEGEKKKMTWLCLMKTKDEVNLLFQNFHKMIETQYNAKGEYHKEIQTLDYNYHIFKDDESRQSELVNQEASELDMSGTTLEQVVMTTQKLKSDKRGKDSTIKPSKQFGFEDAFIEIPNQSSSAESVLNLEPDPS
ncbi:hypothetical protein CK203_028407 [Vitis vinifera]|uniref:Uncharacterized protein n=1 Tax=Vitis vinifera TaxID=29760 RepID=A0A438J0B6_VITVI|nr:hypothetical protein CK203_028407 [Vitis vinifera]